MNELKNIILLGAGAVGTLIAEKLIKMPGISFYAAADQGRVKRYRAEGIFFNGEKLPLNFLAPEEKADFDHADLIIAATKTASLPEALENVVPFTGKNTIFLPLLNGISASDVIAARFPECTVLSGFFLGHASVREGNSIRHDGCGTFYCGGEADALEAVRKLFQHAAINVELPADMTHAIWKKFVLNVGINQTQAAFDADYGTIQRTPELLEYCRELIREAIAIAVAEGVSGTDSMLEPAMEVILSMPPQVKTSMLQDVQAGRQTEVDAFAGTICARAAIHGIPVPRNQEVLKIICEKEAAFTA